MDVVVAKTENGKKFNRLGEELVECKVCGKLTTMTGTKLCDGCWELKKSMDYALRNHLDVF